MAGIRQIALATQQPSAAAAFYEGVFGTSYSGIHHVGFQVEDTASTDAKLKNANSNPRNDINSALTSGVGRGHGGRNVEL